MAELSKVIHDLFVEICEYPSRVPVGAELMSFYELNNVLEMEEDDLEGWDFGVPNGGLLSSAKIYCNFEKRKRVKHHVLSISDPSPFDIELYALEFGFPYSKAKAVVLNRK